jgi:FkbM family methyltransferase
MVRNRLLCDAPFDATVAGAKLRLLPQGSIAFAAWSNYQVETAELGFLLRHLRSGDVFCDVGANIGLFSMIGASVSDSHSGTPKIFAFEPTPATYRTLNGNIALNHFTCIETVNTAIGEKAGIATLFLNDTWKDGMNALAKPQRDDSNVVSEVEVPVVALDMFLQNRGITRIDFLKIDVEGAELAVLKGARRLLESSPECIVMFECYVPNAAAFGYHPEEIMKFFAEIGFHIMLFDESGQLVPLPADCYRGNMLAARPNKLVQLGLMAAAM